MLNKIGFIPVAGIEASIHGVDAQDDSLVMFAKAAQRAKT